MEKDKFNVLKTLPVAGWEWPRIVACVPMTQSLPFADEVFGCFWNIAQQGVPLFHRPYHRTDYLREKYAEELLRSDFTHILMLDSDQKHPATVVQKLARNVIDDP